MNLDVALRYLDARTPDPRLAEIYREYDTVRRYPAGTIVRKKNKDSQHPPETLWVVCHYHSGVLGQTVITPLDSTHHTTPDRFPEHGYWVNNNDIEVIPLGPDKEEIEAALASIRGALHVDPVDPPAPIPAPTGDQWRHTLEYAATALEGSSDNGDQYAAAQIRAHLRDNPPS